MCSNPASIEYAPVKIAITEIMYNNGTDSLEFIEIKNISTSISNLKGLNFSRGITFAFTEDFDLGKDQYCVLTNSKELFQSRYPGIAVGGVFSGRLSDSGERVTLCDSTGFELCDIEYNDKGFWPTAADGLGFSLVPVDENRSGNLKSASDWRASSAMHGSPGKRDSGGKRYAVLVNELVVSNLGDTLDMIELFNADSSKSVDISGWFLTDDRRNPCKFEIPANTTIKAKGYVVFKAASFKKSMAVSTAGGHVYLFSGENGAITGYSHGLEFDPAEQGTVFGLVKNSDGKYFCSILKSVTQKAANAVPLSGKVVISELMYHPLDGEAEFLEIINRTSSEVHLYDTQSPDNTWRINGVSFVFPKGISIGGNEIMVLIDSTETVESFREKHDLDSSVQIFTYAGKLSNSGERISIQKTGAAYVDEEGVIVFPWQDVDVVDYNDKYPWPEKADGDGYSLVRKDLTVWGCEPSNWDISDQKGGTPGK